MINTIGCPSNLELLLHCYYSSEPHPRYDAPAIIEGILELSRAGMIKEARFIEVKMQTVYDVTEKGEAYINYLMQIPFPESVWTIKGYPNGELENDR